MTAHDPPRSHGSSQRALGRLLDPDDHLGCYKLQMVLSNAHLKGYSAGDCSCFDILSGEAGAQPEEDTSLEFGHLVRRSCDKLWYQVESLR